MRTVVGIVRIIRPLNGIVAAASLLPALTLATGEIRYDWYIGGVLFLLVSFGYIINDIYDLIGDRENDQQRPLVSGQLSMTAAWFVVALLATAACLMSALRSLELLSYCLMLVGALVAYAAYISTVLGVANLWVAAMCSSVFLLPLISSNQVTSSSQCLLLVYAVALSFLYHLAREIIKDIEDIRGDLLLKRATLPLIIGAGRSRLVAMIVLLLMVAVSYYVYFQVPQRAYLLIVTVGVNLPTVLIFLIYLRREPVGWAGTVSVALKVLMIPALASLMALGMG